MGPLQVDEQLYQLQHERADLLKRIDEDQEDLNELMAKHKALIAQVGARAVAVWLHVPPWEGTRLSPWLHGGSGTLGGRCGDDRKEWLTAPAPLTHSLESSFKRCLCFSFNSWKIL